MWPEHQDWRIKKLIKAYEGIEVHCSVLRVTGAHVNITDRWTQCSAVSLPIPVVFILVNGFAPQYLAKSKIQLTWIVKSPAEKTPLLPAMGQGSPASWLSAWCSQGKVSPHSAGPVRGFLCWGSHQSMGSQLSCDGETKKREDNESLQSYSLPYLRKRNPSQTQKKGGHLRRCCYPALGVRKQGTIWQN